MLIDLETKENCTTIALHGQFVFDTHRDFRQAATRALQDSANEIRIDLANLGHMDSSGLGMLLVFNDKARNAGKKVVLSNSRGEVTELLKLTRIEAMLAIA